MSTTIQIVLAMIAVTALVIAGLALQRSASSDYSSLLPVQGPIGDRGPRGPPGRTGDPFLVATLAHALPVRDDHQHFRHVTAFAMGWFDVVAGVGSLVLVGQMRPEPKGEPGVAYCQVVVPNSEFWLNHSPCFVIDPEILHTAAKTGPVRSLFARASRRDEAETTLELFAHVWPGDDEPGYYQLQIPLTHS